MVKNVFKSNTLENTWLLALRGLVSYGRHLDEKEPFLEIRNLNLSYSNAFEVNAPNYLDLFGDEFFIYISKVFSPEGDPNTGRNYYKLIYDKSGVNQVERIIAELKKNPFSRSAIIILASSEVDKKPCITEVSFMIRDGQLHMSVIFKSSDFAKKFIPDMTQLSKIHKNISNQLHMPRGEVSALIFSAQLYIKDLNIIKQEIKRLKRNKHFKIDAVVENWDKEAERWDDNIKNPNHYVNFENGYTRFLDFIEAEIPKVNKKLLALDSGCGTGVITDELNNKGYSVVGVDISSKMLQFAHKSDADRKYQLANSLDIPYEDEYFDLVCSRGVLISHVGKKYTELFINEHKRVLKQNGMFVFDFITKFQDSESIKKKNKASFSFKSISAILTDHGFKVLKRSGEDGHRVNAVLCQKISN